MKLHLKLSMSLAVLALGLLPAMAGAVSYVPDYEPEKPPKPPVTKPAPQGKAYGVYCKGQSKKHVKGEKGTAFSRCVKAVNEMRREQAATVSSSAVA